MNFGFKIGVSPVASGQRTAALEVDPQLIVKAGRGGFGLTATASKIMNIAVGENVQFYNNIDGIMQLIQAKDEKLLLHCEENGLDISTDEGVAETVNKLTLWYIAKGYQMYDRKGNPLKVNERVSKQDKLDYIETNFVELVEGNRDALIERANAAGVDGENLTDEELKAYISIDDINGGERDQISGSLTANSAKRQGTGCPLNFTDTHIWGQLRAKATAQQNAIYDIDAASSETATVSNGHTDIEVRMYPIIFKEYVDVVSRNFKKK